jgi:hypothetical protein
VTSLAAELEGGREITVAAREGATVRASKAASRVADRRAPSRWCAIGAAA